MRFEAATPTNGARRMADHELDETKLREGIIDAFILKVSLPLLADAGGQMAILGTGASLILRSGLSSLRLTTI